MTALSDGVLAWNAIRSTPGLGPKRFVSLALALFEKGRAGSDLLGASAKDLRALGLSGKLADEAAKLLADPPVPPPAPEGARLLCPDDEAYPHERLDPAMPLPPLLYASGNVSLLKSSAVAISGSRDASEVVLELARQLATMCAQGSMNVVSGHAAGVDEVAHTSAIDAGGSTTAVLAEGLIRFKPKSRFMEGYPDSVLLVSAFEPDAQWTSFRAMERNATIAALADAVVVVAAAMKGGSWEQAQLCLKAGKRLFVPDLPPGVAPANERLIALGAEPFDPKDPSVILAQVGVRVDSTKASQLGFFN